MVTDKKNKEQVSRNNVTKLTLMVIPITSRLIRYGILIMFTLLCYRKTFIIHIVGNIARGYTAPRKCEFMYEMIKVQIPLPIDKFRSKIALINHITVFILLSSTKVFEIETVFHISVLTFQFRLYQHI